MFAVIKAGSQQFKVKKGDKIQVQLLDEKIGDNLDFPVLLLGDEEKNSVQIGKPELADAKVEAKVIGEGKQDKVRVFKMLRRHRRRVNRGHRQPYTELEITDLK